jgi:peptidoglycan/xylan/chitin deacetylase (PgdA/CDA1 family)
MSRLLFVTYHYVRPVDSYAFPGIYSISLEQFKSQVSEIQNKYYMPTANEVENHIYGKEMLSEDSVFVTFDDGLPEHLHIATEVLASRNICAAFFIASRPYIDKKALTVHKVHWLRANISPDDFNSSFFSELNIKPEELTSIIKLEDACKTYPYDNEKDAMLKFYINFKLNYRSLDEITSKMLRHTYGDEELFCAEFYLSENQIKSISDAGHVIGSHGHSHQPWSRMSKYELEQDLFLNIDFLNKITNRRPDWASYPYGRDWAIPEKAEETCNKFGFKLAFTLDNGWNKFEQNSSKLLRINCNELKQYTNIL